MLIDKKATGIHHVRVEKHANERSTLAHVITIQNGYQWPDKEN